MLPTAERQPTAVSIRPYVIHSDVYIGDYRPTELTIIKSMQSIPLRNSYFQHSGNGELELFITYDNKRLEGQSLSG
jgi:hypothetical protein